MPKSHKHAAIMFTDIVGYTALMGSDEDKAFEILSKNREIHQTFVGKYHGTIIKEIGDGILISFNLASDAVYCAIGIQKKCTEQDIPLKIGIHEGEMVFEGADVLGDAVNVASRLEADSHEGCIYISESVYRDIKNRSDIQTKFLKEKRFKNVDEPIKVYKILCEGDSKELTILSSTNRKKKIIILAFSIIVLAAILYFLIDHWMDTSPKEAEMPNIESTIQTEEVNSIAVMPFKDMSPSQDQEYLGDGIAETIINSLTKVKDLKVPGRTSSFSFKGKDTDIKTIGKWLGVKKILEGSVQKSGNKLRITAQLINVDDGYHIWSEQFEREFTDIFSIQDEISAAVISKMNLDINFSSDTSNNYIGNVNPEAYELFLKGRYLLYSRAFPYNRIEDYKKVETIFLNALKIDPNYSLAHAGLADLYNSMINGIYTSDDEPERQKYMNLQRKHALKAFQIAPNSDYVNSVKGYVHEAFSEYDSAYVYYITALKQNPNDGLNFRALGSFLTSRGLCKEGSSLLDKACEIDPLNLNILWERTRPNQFLGDYQSVLKDCDDIILIEPNFIDAYFWKSLMLINMGRIDDAQEVLNLCQQINSEYEYETWECLILAAKGDKVNTLKCQQDYGWSYAWLGMKEEYIQAELQLLKKFSDKNTSKYIRLINMPKYEWIKDDPRVKEFVQQEQIKYERLKAKYSNLDFLDM